MTDFSDRAASLLLLYHFPAMVIVTASMLSSTLIKRATSNWNTWAHVKCLGWMHLCSTNALPCTPNYYNASLEPFLSRHGAWGFLISTEHSSRDRSYSTYTCSSGPLHKNWADPSPWLPTPFPPHTKCCKLAWVSVAWSTGEVNCSGQAGWRLASKSACWQGCKKYGQCKCRTW